MPRKIDLLRADDLLNLRVDTVNLRLVTEQAEEPALVVENTDRPAYLIFQFPPQTIAEGAYYEVSNLQRKPEDENPDRPDPDQNSLTEPTTLPGHLATSTDPNTGKPFTQKTVAQLGHPSRLVFRVPPEVHVPYTLEGLLDWSKLEPSLNPIAAIDRTPTAEEIASAPAIRPPAPHETALELPYRLWISPNAEAVWEHRFDPFVHRGRTEMWHTRLLKKIPEAEKRVELSKQQTASFRAIWSPDFDADDPLSPAKYDPDLGRTTMTPNDRSQIVVLTSAFHGYESDRFLLFADEVLHNVSAAALPNLTNPVTLTNAAIRDSNLSLLKRIRRVRFPLTRPYIPQPFEAEQVMLTPLGGWLKSRGQWDPPHKSETRLRPDLYARELIETMRTLSQPRANFLANPSLASTYLDVDFQRDSENGSQLDLSEWVHVATQGRDHYVRIVYEGVLKELEHRASLIKVTERKFIEHDGFVEAHLVQRQFIVVREPEKRFPPSNRAVPLKRSLLTTLVTPNISEPEIIPGTHRSFWVKLGNSGTDADFFRFDGKGTDIKGEEMDFSKAMMFVSISDLEDSNSMKAVNAAFNAPDKIAVRSLVIPGQKFTFAEPHPDPAQRNDNTQFVTQTINFVLDAAGHPRMLKADVKIPQVQELVGSDAATTIRFYQGYLDNGLEDAANQTGVFAEVVKLDLSLYKPDNPFAGLLNDTLGVNFSSDKAGGFATPNLGVSTLTRQLGPLAGKVEKAVTNTFDPNEFFKKGLAKLFGSFDLADLLLPSTHDKNAPKLKTATEDIPGGKKLVVTLDWVPDIKNLDLGIAAFVKSDTTQLDIYGRIEKPIKLDTLGAPPQAGVTFDLNGTMNDFQVSVLKSVFINFKQFAFATHSGSKPDVTVKLDPATPLKFDGDLKFVEELRKAIPPDLFGSGPSLDISPAGIRAGFAFALPPIAVGVFALKDVSLGAALTLPFLDGKPSLDFNVSERHHPFQLTVSLFGGGGFFHLELDTAGIKMLEAAFEFGAAAAIDIGVASGEVHIMAGIYFAMKRKEGSTDLACILSGYLRMGGSLSVLGLIKISVEFNLSFTYDGEKDKAYGRATLTVQVEVLCFSKSVELTVERAFGGSSGDPKFIQMFTTADTWSEYALAFA
jgi:hypothetical protein